MNYLVRSDGGNGKRGKSLIVLYLIPFLMGIAIIVAESIRKSLRSFIDLKGKLDPKVKRVLQASDLALVTVEWSFSRTGPDGNPCYSVEMDTNPRELE